MSEIKNIVSGVLIEERKKRADEAYLELESIRDDVFLIERYVSITTNLLNEGYDLNELEMPDSIKNSINADAVKKGLSDSLLVSAKEYIFPDQEKKQYIEISKVIFSNGSRIEMRGEKFEPKKIELIPKNQNSFN